MKILPDGNEKKRASIEVFANESAAQNVKERKLKALQTRPTQSSESQDIHTVQYNRERRQHVKLHFSQVITIRVIIIQTDLNSKLSGLLQTRL